MRNTPQSTKSHKHVILGMILVALFAFTVGYQVASEGYRISIDNGSLKWFVTAQVGNGEQARLDMRRFWRVLSLIDENYLGKENIDRNRLVDGAIRGMVESLGDPYTYYLTADQTSSFQDSLDGKYEGIGVQLGYKEQQLVVVAPLEGGPAERIGMLAGDIIVAVDGESVANLNMGEAVRKIRGEQGTSVVLTLGRRNQDGVIEIFELTVERAEIDAPNIILTWEDGDIAYVHILRFGTGIEKEWQEIVNQIINQNARGLVVDVRDNPGGYLNGAVEIAASFTKRTVIVSEQFANGAKKDFSSNRDGQLQRLPVVVVMNGSSASSSEILAGALKQLAGATLVGERSFGKNTVQEAYQLDGGNSVHVTSANWVLPNGEIIPDDGVVPDIEVSGDDIEDDVQKERALEVLRNSM